MAELEKIILTRVSWPRFPFEIQAFSIFVIGQFLKILL